ncbi:MAG: SAM-dependent methyltransferase [Roseburia sp.]|nr:SAM-dependent methyltransferase [Roseburia sp.]MCM1098883.1 SAM-dependent methyltransferase [Ruminococcus flavefaciens]
METRDAGIYSEAIFESVEYLFQLDETLKIILEKTGAANTEASVASALETEMFYIVKTFFHKDIDLSKEEPVSASKPRRRFRGRMDAVYNDLVIEYKRQDKLTGVRDQEKATEQVETYLLQLERETGTEYNAILTDGQKIRYFYYLENRVHHTPFKKMETEDLDKLVRCLVNVENKKFVPRNIVQDFKLSAKGGITLELAKCLFGIVTNHMTEKTRMLFEEWQELFHLSENDNGQNQDIGKRKKALGEIFGQRIEDVETDYKALFVLQTTYAIIVKLIACRVIARLTTEEEGDVIYFSDLTQVTSGQLRDFMDHLEDGYSYAIGGIRNLLEGDFFSWYASGEQWTEEEADCIRRVILALDRYSYSAFTRGYAAIDIFKDLYMEIMPNEVRHSLGEYFTPSWLADYVIDNSVEMVGDLPWRAIDPCCGSGIFVASLIKHVIGDRDIFSASKEEKARILAEILERVSGVDINPLSVLTARVSYMLAISPLLGDETVEIPVYLGDSANIPARIQLGGVDCYSCAVSTKRGRIDVALPRSFVERRDFLEKMNVIQRLVKTENADAVYEKFVANLAEEERREELLESIRRLSRRLTELHEKRWDGIWMRIVSNYMLVARIRDMDIIVGNPPWVKWEFLPQMYAEKIKSLCVSRHLFSGQTYMGAISLNICALISNVTASAWLRPEGVLAFLMPKTLMTQDSYAGFRNFYTDPEKRERLYLQRADDWSGAGNPFIFTTEKFLTYYYRRRRVDYRREGVPMYFPEKKRNLDIRRINSYNSYREVEDCFAIGGGRAYQLDENRTGFTMVRDEEASRIELYGRIIGDFAYKARSGVEFTPAEVYFLEPTRSCGNEKRYRFRNAEFTGAVYKAAGQGELELETEFIYPVVKSPCIREFGFAENQNCCIFPYRRGETKCLLEAELAAQSEYLAGYLAANRTLIEKQSKRSRAIARGDAFYALSKVGEYTYGDYAVTFRDNTKLAAAVVSPVLTPWGERKMPVCAKHAPIISMDKKGRYITEEEAYYLCGILNTGVVQEYMRLSFSGRSYSIDFNIKCPLYEEENPLHRRIAELSRAAHEQYGDSADVAGMKKEIEACYLELCGRLNG